MIIIDAIKFVLVYLSVYYIFWELYVLSSEHMIELFASKGKNTSYNKFESISMYSYTAWMFLGIFFVDWLSFVLLFALSLIVDIAISSKNIHHYVKIWILRFDSIFSLILIYYIFRNHIHSV